MTPDIDDPYPYSDNTRSCSALGVLLHIVASAVMAGLTYFGFVAIPTWVVCLPLIALFLRSYLYTLFTNAVHEAICTAEADKQIAAEQKADLEAEDREARKSQLNAGFFGEKLFPQVPN